MLELKKINKCFNIKTILSDISFVLDDSNIIGLLGPNGAGKTTLMRIITGIYSPTMGKILWNGKLVNTRSKKHKKRIGYLPENNPLYISLTTLEYLQYIASLKGLNKEESDEEIADMAKKCGLLKVIDNKIEILSKGYKQRIGIAAAIIGDPKIIILDEPTSGLDPNQIIEIRQLIKSLSKKRIIIISTHILPEARDMCDRILVINKGKIVLDQKTKEIKNLEKMFVELTQ